MRTRPLMVTLLVSSAALCNLVPVDQAAAQSCGAGMLNSCMSVSFTPVRPTPLPFDFQAGFAVIGAFNVSVIKCGRPPCELAMAAANQPATGLRIKSGGSQPASLSECSINITGVSSVQSANAPAVALVTATSSVTVWMCQPLTWDPATTPPGTYTPEVRFRLRQGR